jgi:Domain of unknown function (DUF4396)
MPSDAGSVQQHHPPSPPPGSLRLATSATLHCLLGCGLGEIAGTALGGVIGWTQLPTTLLGILAGIVGGFALGMRPLRRAGYGWRDAARQVLVTEGLSIAVMETAEVILQARIPMIMNASLLTISYWLGMLASLVAGFAAAWPVNLWLVRRGVRHQH